MLTVDFGAATARLDAAGSAPLALQGLTADGGRVRFQVPFGTGGLVLEGERGPRQIRGTARDGERVLPFWLEPLPELPPPRDRVEGWRQDLDALRRRFLRYDRSFDDRERNACRKRLLRLERSLAARSYPEVTVELARALALAGNAHTRLYLVRNRTEVRRLPIRTWWFGRELRVVRASAEHRDLLGCRVTRIGGLGVEAAAERVRGIKAGNRSWQRYMGTYFLTSPEILAGAGVIRGVEAVPLTLSCGGGRPRVVRLAPLPLQRKTTPTESWWDLAPAHPGAEGLLPALPAERAPLYLRRPAEHYWFEPFPELRAVYFQYNRSQEMPNGERMAAFTDRLAEAVRAQPLRAFIVDVRFNTGGDLGVATPLVARLSELLRGVPVFIVTGRATFSAGITHAAQWTLATRATIVGEPVGDDLDMWAEGGNLVLPYSRLTAHYANAFHAYSRRRYPAHEPYLLDLDVETLAPGLPVEASWDDYAAGRDPALEAIAARLRLQASPPGRVLD